MSLNKVLDNTLPYGVRLSLYIGAWLLAIVMGIAGVSTYYSSNPSPIGFIKAVFMFAGFLLILHGASGILFDSRKPVGWRSIALIVAVSMLAVDTFTISHEQQTGIMEKIKTSQQAVTDSGTKSQHLAGLRKELAACPENHYTKCKQPLLAAIQQAESDTSGTAFNANAAGEEAYWVALAEWFNKDRLPEDKIDAGQVALYVYAFLGFLGSVFIILGFGFYGATTSDPQHSPTPLPPTGTDDTTNKSGDYRASKVGFNSPAPVPTASSKSSVPRSVSQAYPTQNTHRVERIQSVSTTPRASVSAPVVTMAAPSGAQAVAAQRWHMDGNTALQAYPDAELRTKNELIERTSTLDLSVAEPDTLTDGYAHWIEAIQVGRCDTLIRDTKQWVQDHGYVEVGKTKQAQKLAEDYFSKADREGRIRVIDGWKSGMSRKYEWEG